MAVSLACYKFLRAWDAGVRDTAGLAEALGVTPKNITSYTCRYRKLGYICDGGLTAEGEAAMEDYPRWAEGMARSAERPRSWPVTEQERRTAMRMAREEGMVTSKRLAYENGGSRMHWNTVLVHLHRDGLLEPFWEGYGNGGRYIIPRDREESA